MKKDVVKLAKSVRPLKVELKRGGSKKAAAKQTKPYSMPDEDYAAELKRRNLRPQRDPNYGLMNLMFSNPDYQDYLKSKDQEYSLNEPQMDLFPEKSKGGEISDSEFQNLFRALQKQKIVDENGHLNLYHVTPHYESILNEGLIPGKNQSPHQYWKSKHSSHSTYFHVDPKAAMKNADDASSDENISAVLRTRLPFTKQNLSRILPDEDVSLDKKYAARALLNKEPVVVSGRIPKENISLHYNNGGEVKDPTKRALFNMFKPQESNLPAFAAPAPALNPTAPEPAETTSEPSPDILGKAAEKLSATPMSRRGFMETARNAVAAARMAPKIKKLAKAEKVAAPAIDPKKAIKNILSEEVDLKHPIMKGLLNGTVPFHIEDLYPDHFNHDPEDVPGMEHMNSDEIGYELMQIDPRRVIDFINGGEEHVGYMDDELSDELHGRFNKYVKEKLENKIGRKVSNEELKKLLDEAEGNYAFRGIFHDDSPEEHSERLKMSNEEPEHKSGGGSADDDHPEHYRELNDLGLYSKAAEVAQEATGQNESMTPDQWVNYLTQRDVKPDEIKWSHFNNAFSDNEKVHKSDVAAHFNHQNQEPYVEQLYNDEGLKYSNDLEGLGNLAHDMANNPDLFKQVLPQPHLFAHAKRKEANYEDVADWLFDEWSHDLENYIQKQKGPNNNMATRHSAYQMDGISKNYRELVLQHNPEEEKFIEVAHFPEAVNPLLHIRMSDRKGTNGEKLLHIEEMQSDWGQRGAYAGFDQADKAKLFKKFTEADRALYQFDFAFRNKVRNLASSRPDGGVINRYAENAPLNELIMTYGDADDHKEYKKFKNEHQKSLSRSQAPRVEAGPHVDDTNKWVDLGLKRILKEAADGGYHGIVFTPGDKQMQRWGNDRRLIKPYDETLPSRMQKLINKHDPSLKFGKYSYELPKQYADDPDSTVHHLPMSEKAIASIKKGQERFQRGGEVEGFGDGGTPSLAARRAEAQAYIKDLVEQRKKYPKGSPDYDFYTQQIAEQSKIVNEKGASSPPPKAAVAEVGHNRPPREMNVLGTYSHAAEVAEKAPKSEMTPQDWVNYLKGQPGVKEDELKWAEIGKLKPFGDSKTISKQRVAARLNDANKEDYEENVRKAKYFKDDVGPKTSLVSEMLGNPELMKKVLGNNSADAINYLKEIDEDEENKKLFTSSQLLAKKRSYLEYEYGDEIFRYLQKVQPKFEKYTLKGKDKNENYREHILQWKPENGDFSFPLHFPENNPLFHLRFADVNDPEGKKYLHLEEAQSDWGQKGRGKFMDKDEIANAKNEYHLTKYEYDKADNDFQRWFMNAQNKHFQPYKDQVKKKREELKIQELNDLINQSMDPEEIERAEEEFRNAERELSKFHFENYDKIRNAWSDLVTSKYAGTEGEELYRKRNEASKKHFEAQKNYDKAQEATPEGPYVGDTNKWTKVMVKKILHEMAKGGYDGLIVTPGSEQSKRWSGQPGVKKFYDETLLPEIQRQMASHDKNTGKSAIYKFPVESKTNTAPDVQDVREMLGMPDADIPAVAAVWNNLQEHQRARYWNDYVAAGKNVTSTTVDLPLFKTTPQANESIMNNQKAWRRGGMVDRPIAKSEKIKHNPAIIEQALNKIRSLPQISDPSLSGKQGRLF